MENSSKMPFVRTAVIVGSGMQKVLPLRGEKSVSTEFGTALIHTTSLGGQDLLVLLRHGAGHSVPPHRINYRANIAALRKMRAERIVATTAVGSLNPKFGVGELGVVTQFLDFTKNRAATFFDDKVVHTDMTAPYDAELNAQIVNGGKSAGIKVHGGLIYACEEGPRFETAAEIRMLRKMGADVVGMTGVPEVVLAREVGIRYSSIAIATNWAAGIQEKVSHEEVVETMKRCGEKVRSVIEATVGGGK
jgi:5'-methylthioadenosine phosphorylase